MWLYIPPSYADSLTFKPESEGSEGAGEDARDEVGDHSPPKVLRGVWDRSVIKSSGRP